MGKQSESIDRKPTETSSKSSRIYANSNNVNNKYKAQADKNSARDRNKTNKDLFTMVDHNAYYTHRDCSPAFTQGTS